MVSPLFDQDPDLDYHLYRSFNMAEVWSFEKVVMWLGILKFTRHLELFFPFLSCLCMCVCVCVRHTIRMNIHIYAYVCACAYICMCFSFFFQNFILFSSLHL